MKIAKYLHSCLLFEDEGQKLLFDPGTITFAEGLVTPETFRDVSTIVITHGHPDHLDLENLKQILALSNAEIITNGEVAETLAREGIAATVVEEGPHTAGPVRLLAIPTPHEPILAPSTPRHTAYLVNDRILNCADSFGDPLLAHAGMEILIMPVMAPFLTEVGAFAFAQRMRPQHVIPIHDGYSKPFFLKLRYDNYEKHFDQIGVRFHRLAEPGDSVTV